jgi:anti-sigma B factor antagonist
MTDAGHVRPPRFEVQTEPGGPRWTIRLSGELDAAVASRLKAALAEAQAAKPQQIRVDVKNLAFIDSTGIQMLVGAKLAGADEGCELIVVRPTGDVKRIFDVIALDKLLTIVDD